MFHDPKNGFMSYFSKRKGKPPAPTRMILPPHSSSDLNSEMDGIRKDLRVSATSKILLLLSIATDDMIRQVVMHPHVWFMDVTSGTNKQKKDWFLMAVRTPQGKTFPGNLTVIPSGKRWVFSTIYQRAFILLYGEATCSHNCLLLCDEDHCEYGPFEDAIVTNKCFQKLSLFICNFHGIWMPFKEKVFKLLPCKDGGSQELTEVGREYGQSNLQSEIPWLSCYLIQTLVAKETFLH